MQIYGPSHVHGPQPIHGPHAKGAAHQPGPASSTVAGDQLELSDAARLAGKIDELPDVRHDLVNRVRAAIADGSYETADKLDVALDRLLDEIG